MRYGYLVRFIELHWGPNALIICLWKMLLERLDLVQHCAKNDGREEHRKEIWFVLQGSWKVPPFAISRLALLQSCLRSRMQPWAFFPVRLAYSHQSKQYRNLQSEPPFLMERPCGFPHQYGSIGSSAVGVRNQTVYKMRYDEIKFLFYSQTRKI